MALDADGEYTELSIAHGFAFELEARSLSACLARAVEALAESFADVHPSLATTAHPVEVTGPTPSALLLGVLEECLRHAREGLVAVSLRDGVVDGGILRGIVETVDARESELHGPVPHVLSWHEVRIDDDPASGTWRGRVVAR